MLKITVYYSDGTVRLSTTTDAVTVMPNGAVVLGNHDMGRAVQTVKIPVGGYYEITVS